MSGKLTRSARGVVADAVGRAHSEDAREVREEHLLAAVMNDPGTQQLLREVSRLPDTPVLLAEVRQARRRGGLRAVEASALAEFGVDLDALVGRVEAELGEGALDDSHGPGRRGWGGPPVSAAFRLVLQAAQRQASARGDRDLDTQHLLLGLLAQPGLVADTLGSRGVTVASVLAGLDAHSERGSRHR